MTGDESVRERIFQEVREERARQDKKFGFRNSHTPERWLVILMEEVGEVSNATLEHDLVNYYKEFIQVGRDCGKDLRMSQTDIPRDFVTWVGQMRAAQRLCRNGFGHQDHRRRRRECELRVDAWLRQLGFKPDDQTEDTDG